MKGYRAAEVNPETGKRSIVFSPREGYSDLPLTIACGQCIGCRLERSRRWAIRCVHEASLHEKNCFITLTYRDECMPELGTLVLDDWQRFMKRLRKEFGAGIRFFHCGEYGEKYKRPHYHACLFNFDFDDRVLWSRRNGFALYTSETLSRLWPSGFSTVGDVTFQSAAYVARYITKKITGRNAIGAYDIIDESTGEVLGEYKAEYVTMSRRPGIGRAWLERNYKEVYPSDFIVINGKKMKPPPFYDHSFEITHPDEMAKVKAKRALQGEAHADDNTPARLAVRERCQMARLTQLKRGYENGD